MAKLTRWQVDWAIKLRLEKDSWGEPKWSWVYIAEHLGCCDQTVKKAVASRVELATQLVGLKRTEEI